MESRDQGIQEAKNPQTNKKKSSNYVIVREEQKIHGTSTEKKLQASFTAKNSFPPGYRFMPTDDELIVDYLLKKVNNQPIPIDEISDVYLKQNNPKALTETYPKLGENEWYFFTPRDRKYPNGSRPNRAADTGYWKATGADKPVRINEKTIVGFRKALVFYEGKPPKGEKTSWIMHEFRLNQNPRNKRSADDMRLDDWVLCRIYEKSSRPNRNRQGNEGGNPVDDDNTNHPLQVNADHRHHHNHAPVAAANYNDDDNSNINGHDEVVDQNLAAALDHIPENLDCFGGGDHWLQSSLQNLLMISPSHSSMDEPALINGHLHSSSSILDYGLINPVGQNAFHGISSLNEHENGQHAFGFQHGDFPYEAVNSWGNGSFHQLPSYFAASSSSGNTVTPLYNSFMKVEDPFNGTVTNSSDYDQFMPRKRRL